MAAAARVARLATVGADLQPHLVPVTFALLDTAVVIGIDQKPKTSHDLRRLRNIRQNPRVALLWDRYDEDWTALWWVRADGTARVLATGSERATTMRTRAIDALVTKYPQYSPDPPQGPVITIAVHRWSGWSWA
nr:TIGR03668 family PPOX class F420-dependent oxidoreductase [Microlunatus panaciterrae]